MPRSAKRKRAAVVAETSPSAAEQQQQQPVTAWSCAVCTLENDARRRRCEACGNRRPVAEEGGGGARESTVASAAAAAAAAATTTQPSCSEEKRGPNEATPSRVAEWLRKRKRRRSVGRSPAAGAAVKVTLRLEGDEYEPLEASLLSQQTTSLTDPARRGGDGGAPADERPGEAKNVRRTVAATVRLEGDELIGPPTTAVVVAPRDRDSFAPVDCGGEERPSNNNNDDDESNVAATASVGPAAAPALLWNSPDGMRRGERGDPERIEIPSRGGRQQVADKKQPDAVSEEDRAVEAASNWQTKDAAPPPPSESPAVGSNVKKRGDDLERFATARGEAAVSERDGQKEDVATGGAVEETLTAKTLQGAAREALVESLDDPTTIEKVEAAPGKRPADEQVTAENTAESAGRSVNSEATSQSHDETADKAGTIIPSPNEICENPDRSLVETREETNHAVERNADDFDLDSSVLLKPSGKSIGTVESTVKGTTLAGGETKALERGDSIGTGATECCPVTTATEEEVSFDEAIASERQNKAANHEGSKSLGKNCSESKSGVEAPFAEEESGFLGESGVPEKKAVGDGTCERLAVDSTPAARADESQDDFESSSVDEMSQRNVGYGFFYTPATQSQDRLTQESRPVDSHLSQEDVGPGDKRTTLAFPVCSEGVIASPMREAGPNSECEPARSLSPSSVTEMSPRKNEITRPTCHDKEDGKVVASTADGSEVNLQRTTSQEHFMETSSVAAVSSKTPTPAKSSRSPAFTLFRTAGKGKTISVSSASLAKASSILNTNSKTAQAEMVVVPFRRDFPGSLSERNGRSAADAQTKSPKETNTSVTASALAAGFQTAGKGKAMAVSSTSLAKAVTILGGNGRETCIDTAFRTPFVPKKNIPNQRSIAPMKSLPEATPTAAVTVSCLKPDRKYDGPAAFCTAGHGKKIEVSATSLARAKALFRGAVGACTAGGPPPRVSIGSTGVKDRGTDLNLSMDSFSPDDRVGVPARVSIETAGRRRESHANFETAPSSGVSSPCVVLSSFQTAGQSRKIDVSTESLARADRRLSDTTQADGPTNANSSGTPVAFQTAGQGKKIEVSGQSLEIAENILFDERTASTDVPTTSSWSTAPIGFQTAGLGKKVEVSTKSLAKANRLLSGVTFRTDGPAPTGSSSAPIGFQTVGQGKKIDISSESLARAGSLFSSDATPVATATATNSSAVSVGFQTAGLGKKIDVTTESLARVHNVLSEASSSTAPVGFQTAGQGKKIDVSAESLARVDGVFFYNSTWPPADDAMPTHSLIASVGFQTAGQGKKIVVSSESLARANSVLFGAATRTDTVTAKRAEPGAMHESSFETTVTVPASSGTVSVPTLASFSVPFVAFQTAGQGKRIEIATESMARANHLFATCSDKIGAATSREFSTENQTRAAMLSEERTAQGDIIDAVATSSASTDETTSAIAEVTVRQRVEEKRVRHSFQDAFSMGIMTTDLEECKYCGVDDVTLMVNGTNAAALHFDLESARAGFVDRVDPADKPTPAVTALRKALEDLGCESQRITDKWIANHFRWIAWKLASVERRFAAYVGGEHLTFARVVDQLLRRYKKELQGGSRPALRRILNRDASAKCMLILCVASIHQRVVELGTERQDELGVKRTSSTDGLFLELTDGWYSLRASPDERLQCFVRDGTICVGTKLLVSNASLIGFDEGIDPLDPAYDPCKPGNGPVLRINANSTRLARWNAKLGFVRPSRSLASQDGMLLVRRLADILPDGGSVPLLDLRVVRRYPMLFLEKRESDGNEATKARVLSESEEAERLEEQEKLRQRSIEQFLEEVRAECTEEVDESAPGVWNGMMNDKSPSEFYEELDDDSRGAIDRWNTQRAALIRHRMEQEVEARLEDLGQTIQSSTPFVRILVESYSRSASEQTSSARDEAVLTVWNPSDEQLDVLKEGSVLRMKNLDPREARRDGLLQLSANKSTAMSIVPNVLPYPARSDNSPLLFTSIFRLHLTSKRWSKQKTHEHRILEANVVGIVLKVERQSDDRGWSVVLTDESNLLLRVESQINRRDVDSFFASLSFSAQENVQKACVVAEFRDVRLMKFDCHSNCAVLQFRDTSSLLQKAKSGRADRLHRWSLSTKGRPRLVKLASYVDLNLPVFCRARAGCLTAVGHIAGFHFDTRQLHVRVDCGSSELHKWEFPLSLIFDLLDAPFCGVRDGDVVLNEEEETRADQMTSIGKLYRARQSLYRFSLQRITDPHSDCGFEVTHIAPVDTEGLANLLMA